MGFTWVPSPQDLPHLLQLLAAASVPPPPPAPPIPPSPQPLYRTRYRLRATILSPEWATGFTWAPRSPPPPLSPPPLSTTPPPHTPTQLSSPQPPLPRPLSPPPPIPPTPLPPPAPRSPPPQPPLQLPRPLQPPPPPPPPPLLQPSQMHTPGSQPLAHASAESHLRSIPIDTRAAAALAFAQEHGKDQWRVVWRALSWDQRLAYTTSAHFAPAPPSTASRPIAAASRRRCRRPPPSPKTSTGSSAAPAVAPAGPCPGRSPLILQTSAEERERLFRKYGNLKEPTPAAPAFPVASATSAAPAVPAAPAADVQRVRGRSPRIDYERRLRGERGVSPSEEGQACGQRPSDRRRPGTSARECYQRGERQHTRSRRGVRWGRRSSHIRWLRGVCASSLSGTGATLTFVRRVAYGEGEGRSRSGPTSIHSGVNRMPPLTQERRCMLCREDLFVWDSTFV